MSAEKEKLAALEAELIEVNIKLKEVPLLEVRRMELQGYWRDKGEIEEARMAYYESQFPIFSAKEQLKNKQRIVNVDEKWISIKTYGYSDNEITRYKITNGWPERSRDGRYAIDVEKALEIWKAHTGENKSEE